MTSLRARRRRARRRRAPGAGNSLASARAGLAAGPAARTARSTPPRGRRVPTGSQRRVGDRLPADRLLQSLAPDGVVATMMSHGENDRVIALDEVKHALGNLRSRARRAPVSSSTTTCAVGCAPMRANATLTARRNSSMARMLLARYHAAAAAMSVRASGVTMTFTVRARFVYESPLPPPPTKPPRPDSADRRPRVRE